MPFPACRAGATTAWISSHRTSLTAGRTRLKRFVNACHAKGLAVLLDVVYNHLGPVGQLSGQIWPVLHRRHHTPWGDAVNFEDRGSHEVRRFFCDNALMWLRDYHFDGLRLDAVHALHRSLRDQLHRAAWR